jgi:hypothetical protein
MSSMDDAEVRAMLRGVNHVYVSAISEVVHHGNFVLYQGADEALRVGKFLKYYPSRKVCLLEEYPFLNKKATVYNPFLGYVINSRVLQFPARLLREVSVSKTKKEVAEEALKEICFVFSEFDLEDPKYSWCAGVKNAYFLSSTVSGIEYEARILGCEDTVSEMRKLRVDDEHLPFPVESDLGVVTYAETVWFGLLSIYETLQKGLNRYGKKQPLHFNIASTLSPGVFVYLMRQVKAVVEIHERPNKSSRVRTGAGFTKFRKVGNYRAYRVLRFDSDDTLKLLRSILGISCTEGIRSRAPSLKNFPQGKLLHEFSYLHYIKGKNEVEVPFVSRTSRRGIDLRFDGYSQLKVSGRFKKWLYKQDYSTGKVVGCPSHHVHQILSHFRPDVATFGDIEIGSDDDVDCCTIASQASASVGTAATNTTEDSMISLLQPSTCFRFDGKVHEITEVSNVGVITCKLINKFAPSAMRLTYSAHDEAVRSAIREFNCLGSDGDSVSESSI